MVNVKDGLLLTVWSPWHAVCTGRFWFEGHHKALEFMRGTSSCTLSVDNLLVFLMIFGYFQVPPSTRQALFWGIIGALVIRAVFIFAGVGLISGRVAHLRLGLFLIFTRPRWREQDREVHPEKNPSEGSLQDNAGGPFFDGPVLPSINVAFARHAALRVDLALGDDGHPLRVDSIGGPGHHDGPLHRQHVNGFEYPWPPIPLLSPHACCGSSTTLHWGTGGHPFFYGVKMLLTELVKIPVSVSLG